MANFNFNPYNPLTNYNPLTGNMQGTLQDQAGLYQRFIDYTKNRLNRPLTNPGIPNWSYGSPGSAQGGFALTSDLVSRQLGGNNVLNDAVKRFNITQGNTNASSTYSDFNPYARMNRRR